MPKVLAISHVSCEDLGTLEPELLQAGLSIETVNAATADFAAMDDAQYALVVVLGGPMGVYELERFPFLKAEIAMVRQRLNARRPTIGICLGSQIMAAALGARVFSGTNGKEIGWAPIMAAADVAGSAAMTELLTSGLNVFHWHGDTFDLPVGARLLASTRGYLNQAFALGDYALGLQFHLEVTADGLESWYVEHARELHQEAISVERLRHDSSVCGPALEPVSRRFWRSWLTTALQARRSAQDV